MTPSRIRRLPWACGVHRQAVRGRWVCLGALGCGHCGWAERASVGCGEPADHSRGFPTPGHWREAGGGQQATPLLPGPLALETPGRALGGGGEEARPQALGSGSRAARQLGPRRAENCPRTCRRKQTSSMLLFSKMKVCSSRLRACMAFWYSTCQHTAPCGLARGSLPGIIKMSIAKSKSYSCVLSSK